MCYSADDHVDDPPVTTSPSRLTSLIGHSAFRYLLIGGASFVIDFALLVLLHKVLSWPLWFATGTAFLTSFIFNYLFQRTFSFGSQATHASTLVKYLTLLAFNTVATIGLVSLIDLTSWGWGAGKVTATVVTTAWNYFAYRYWVFAHPQLAPRAGHETA